MLTETIARIEARLKTASELKENERAELLDLLSQAKEEARSVRAPTGDESGAAAESAAGSSGIPESLKGSAQELSAAVEGFEKSHPQLVALVNRIATTLSNMGI